MGERGVIGGGHAAGDVGGLAVEARAVVLLHMHAEHGEQLGGFGKLVGTQFPAVELVDEAGHI